MYRYFDTGFNTHANAYVSALDFSVDLRMPESKIMCLHFMATDIGLSNINYYSPHEKSEQKHLRRTRKRVRQTQEGACLPVCHSPKMSYFLLLKRKSCLLFAGVSEQCLFFRRLLSFHCIIVLQLSPKNTADERLILVQR